MKHLNSKVFGWLLLALLLSLLAGCSQSANEPLYVIASHDANGDGELDDNSPGEEAPAIYQLQVDDKDLRLGRLTDPSEYIPRQFTLSPDRTKLAFSTEPIEEIGELVYIKDLTSQQPPQQVLADTNQVQGLYWSRDGEHLAAVVTSSVGLDGVVIASPDGTVERQEEVQLFAENELQDYAPLVSPDFSTRLWPEGVEGGYLYTLTGPIEKPAEGDALLTQYPLIFIAWAPDSQRLLMLGNTANTADEFGHLPVSHGALYTIQPDGNDLTPLTAAGGASKVAAWSPDGSTIAYLTLLEDTDNDGTADTRSEAPLLYILNKDSTARRINLGDEYRLNWDLEW